MQQPYVQPVAGRGGMPVPQQQQVPYACQPHDSFRQCFASCVCLATWSECQPATAAAAASSTAGLFEQNPPRSVAVHTHVGSNAAAAARRAGHRDDDAADGRRASRSEAHCRASRFPSSHAPRCVIVALRNSPFCSQLSLFVVFVLFVPAVESQKLVLGEKLYPLIHASQVGRFALFC